MLLAVPGKSSNYIQSWEDNNVYLQLTKDRRKKFFLDFICLPGRNKNNEKNVEAIQTFLAVQ